MDDLTHYMEATSRLKAENERLREALRALLDHLPLPHTFDGGEGIRAARAALEKPVP